jgi:hypothetical protein
VAEAEQKTRGEVVAHNLINDEKEILQLYIHIEFALSSESMEKSVGRHLSDSGWS